MMTATKMIELEKERTNLKIEIYKLREKSRKSWMVNGGYHEEQKAWDEEANELQNRVVEISKELL